MTAHPEGGEALQEAIADLQDALDNDEMFRRLRRYDRHSWTLEVATLVASLARAALRSPALEGHFEGCDGVHCECAGITAVPASQPNRLSAVLAYLEGRDDIPEPTLSSLRALARQDAPLRAQPEAALDVERLTTALIEHRADPRQYTRGATHVCASRRCAADIYARLGSSSTPAETAE